MTATAPLLLAAAGVGFGHAVLPDHWAPLAVIGRTRRYPLTKVARLSGLAGVAHVLVSLVLGAVIVAVGLQIRSSVEGAQEAIVGGLLIATGIGFAIVQASGHGHSHPHDANEHEHGGRNQEHRGRNQEHRGPNDEHRGPNDEHRGPNDEHRGPNDEHRGPNDEHAGRNQEHAGPNQEHAGREHEPGPRGHSALAVMVPFGAAASPDLTILPVFLAATTAGAATAVGSLIVFGAVTIATIVGLTLVATAGGYHLGGRWLDRWGNAFTAAVLIVIGALVLAGIL